MKLNRCSKESCFNLGFLAGAYQWLYLVIGFLFGSIFWIFFPGRTTPDSASHISQAVTGSFNAHHARLTSYLISWLPDFEIFPNYAWFFLLNIVLALAFIPSFVRFALAGRTPAPVVFVLTTILSIGALLVLAPLTITVWKDALLNSLLIVMSIVAAVLLIGTNLCKYTKMLCAVIGASLACAVINIRPNGLLATIPLMAVYFFAGFSPIKNRVMRIGLAALWILALPVLSVSVVRVVLPAEPADQEEHIMNSDLIGMRTFGADLLAAAAGSEPMRLLVDDISRQPWQGEGGNCWEYHMPQDLTHIKKLWLSSIIKNPVVYLRVRWTCFNALLIPPQGRGPVAYSKTAFTSSSYIKEFIERSPIREQTLSLFDEMYTRIAIGSIVFKVNLALLCLSVLLFLLTRDRSLAAAAVINGSSTILFLGYFFIITTGDFRFISWSLSSAVLSIILCIAFVSRYLFRGRSSH